jgi:hypothetical protein
MKNLQMNHYHFSPIALNGLSSRVQEKNFKAIGGKKSGSSG